MESSFAHSTLAGALPDREPDLTALQQVWARLRGRQVAVPWRPAVADELARPPLAVNLRDLMLAALVLALVAGWVSSLLQTAHQRGLAQIHAAEVIRRADSALHEVDLQLASLASDPGHGGSGCSLDLTLALVRHSLDAGMVRRFVLESGSRTCGPMGEQPPPAAALPLPGLGLSTGTALEPRLIAQRRSGSGASAWAELDPASFAQRLLVEPADGVPHYVQLFDAAGALLINLDSRGRPLPRDSGVSALQRSAQHPIEVLVTPDPSALRRDVAWHVAGAAAAALAVGGIVAWVAWRRTLRRARPQERIARALRKRQFEPFVQPVVELATGRCVGGEILMRWNHPQRGWIAPGEFIEDAERSGLIVGMTHLVMERAAMRLAPLARLAPQLRFAFNITPVDLRQPGFPRRLAATFQGDSLPREQVMLELTERDLVDPQAAEALMTLRKDGWRIAMDDFGTGQSSLSLLEQLQVDRIKIDRSFVQTIDASTERRPVLDAIIGLAHSLGVPLVAEGVETAAQRDYLGARGVGHAQGYLWARPMTMADFERWMASHDDALAKGLAPILDAAGLDAPGRELFEAMQAPGGLDVRDRVWHARSWPQCFVGREAVDWIVRYRGVSRREALRMGRQLAACGLIRHAADEHDLRDAELFYRLVGPGGDDAPPGPALPADLVSAMRAGDANGPQLASHRRGVALHRQCARGRDIVGWIMARHRVDESTALHWGAELMRQGRLRHVYDDRPLGVDGNLFRPA